MSFSNEHTEWHLTPRGWEIGTDKTDGSPEVVRPRPKDALMTIDESEYMGHSRSRLQERTDVLWQKKGAEVEIKKLLKKFPREGV